jgi:hypothetical protein
MDETLLVFTFGVVEGRDLRKLSSGTGLFTRENG